MLKAGASVALDEIKLLRSNGMLSSAEILCSMYISASASSVGGEATTAVAMELFADILVDKNELKRALSFYRQALQQYKLSFTAAKQQKQTQSLGSNFIETAEEAQVRYKEVLCLLKIGGPDASKALPELEAIPSKLRDCKIHMTLGRLYRSANRKRDAINSFKEVLATTPLCIEALEALVSLGVDSSDLLSLTDDSLRGKPAESLVDDGWMHGLITGLVQYRNCDYDKAETSLKRLQQQFPRNIYLMGNMARCHNANSRTEEALVMYRQMRRFDSNIISYMDEYAHTLLNSNIFGAANELSRLAHDVLSVSPPPGNAIGWLIVAMCCEANGDSEKALSYIEKAINIDSKFPAAHRLKGQLLLLHGRPELAVNAFFTASVLDHDVNSVTGLINSYLALGKNREAINHARDSLIALPRSSAVYVVLGNILSRSQEGYTEASAAYTRALKFNPTNKAAALQLSIILTEQKKFAAAEQVLLDTLNRVSCNRLRTQLAKVYVIQGRHEDAIKQLHTAISLAPDDCAEATVELERLEQVLQDESQKLQDCMIEEEEEEIEDVVGEEDLDECYDDHDE